MGFFKDLMDDSPQAPDAAATKGTEEIKKEYREERKVDERNTQRMEGTTGAARPGATVAPQGRQPGAMPKAPAGSRQSTQTKPLKKPEASHIQDMPLDIPGYDETTIVTNGSKITGSIESNGSVEVYGIVNGDIKCNGLLTIAGIQQGNVEAGEVSIDGARIKGEIKTAGSAKISSSSVVVGNIYASSVYIAGAIKGDVDVKGNVLLDSSAIILGNIKCRVLQITEGAVVEGNCTQTYAEVDINAIFDESKEAGK